MALTADCGSGGRWFESTQLYQWDQGLSQVGHWPRSALAITWQSPAPASEPCASSPHTERGIAVSPADQPLDPSTSKHPRHVRRRLRPYSWPTPQLPTIPDRLSTAFLRAWRG